MTWNVLTELTRTDRRLLWYLSLSTSSLNNRVDVLRRSSSLQLAVGIWRLSRFRKVSTGITEKWCTSSRKASLKDKNSITLIHKWYLWKSILCILDQINCVLSLPRKKVKISSITWSVVVTRCLRVHWPYLHVLRFCLRVLPACARFGRKKIRL